MEWTRALSVALVVLVTLWIAGSTIELFVTAFSIGDHVTAAAATVAFVAAVVLGAIAVGVRGSGGLDNPEAYW